MGTSKRTWALREGRLEVTLWAVAAALCATALVRAASAEVSREATAPTLAEQRAAFSALAAKEPSLRDQAIANFPSDPWSQDDDFHASARQQAYDWAASHRLSRSAIWRALDRGMREKWPLPAGVRLRPTVAPCQPRTLY